MTPSSSTKTPTKKKKTAKKPKGPRVRDDPFILHEDPD
jgi:hypothetical protein